MRRARRPTKIFETQASAHVASPHEALEKIRRPSTWPDWQSEILATEGPDEVRVGDHVTGDASMLGFAVGGRADIIAVGDGGLEQDVIVGIRMKVRYDVAPAPGGWTVTHTIVVDLPAGLSGRVLSFFLKRRLRRMQSQLIEKLAAGAEAPGAPAARHAKAEL